MKRRAPRTLPGRPSAKLEEVWRKRLALSGFDDLEGTDRDGPLSNRGNLHDGTGRVSGPKADDGEAGADGDWASLAVRIQSGAARTDMAQDVARERFGGHNPKSRLRRKIWKTYAEEGSIKAASRTLGISFHAARTAVIAGAEAAKEPGDQTCDRAKIRSLVRRTDHRVLEALASALLAQAAQ